MPASIDATVGGASANCYVTEAEAAAYFAEQTASTAWDAATANQRVRALITATRRIDEETPRGDRTSTTQALQWPRYLVTDPDGGRDYLPGDTIPQRVKRAVFKLAYELVAGTYAGAPTGLEGFAKVTVGPISVEPRESRRSDALPDNVRREIEPLILSADGSVRLVKG